MQAAYFSVGLAMSALALVAVPAQSQTPSAMAPATRIFIDDSSFHLHPWGTLAELKAIYARVGMTDVQASCLSKECKHIALFFAGPKKGADMLLIEPFRSGAVSGWAVTEEQGDSGKVKGDDLLVYLASIQALGQPK